MDWKRFNRSVFLFEGLFQAFVNGLSDRLDRAGFDDDVCISVDPRTMHIETMMRRCPSFGGNKPPFGKHKFAIYNQLFQ